MGRKVSKRKVLPDLGLDPRKLDADAAKTLRIGLRVSPSEKREVEATARRLGVSLSDYLMGLHAQAVAALGKGRKGGRSRG